MSDSGRKRAGQWRRRVARSLADSPDPERWEAWRAEGARPPDDGSPQAAWERLFELVERRPVPDSESLWEMAGCLFEICGWYLRRPVTELRGVGPARARTLARLDIHTLRDLLLHLPRTYSDRRFLQPIREVEPGGETTVRGEVLSVQVRRGRRPRLEVRLGDDTGTLRVNFWNQVYLQNQIARGQQLLCTGTVEEYRDVPRMNNPDFNVLDGEEPPGSIRAIYPGTEGLSQVRLRRWIHRALERTRSIRVDCLPGPVRRQQNLPGRRRMFEDLHEPDSPQKLEEARRRFVFEEFFWYQLLFLRHRWRVRHRSTDRDYTSHAWRDRFLEELPFSLTEDQTNALETIEEDLEASVPMNRLLQGDVGTGKTAVAAASLLRAVENGYQGAMMAPTEILARQHLRTLRERFRGLPVRVELLLGGGDEAERRKRRRALRAGEIDVAVGTHALLTEDVTFQNLAYVVIDEQHRFGVQQRRALRKKGPDTDLLIVSATPIPRSLARTVYADLSVTTLMEYPAGRRDVHTSLLEDTGERRRRLYERLEKQIEGEGGAFLVFPAVEDGEGGIEGAVDARRRAEKRGWFASPGTGLLHGRMDGDKTRRTVEAFRSGEIRVLFCTTVIEIGIDVPAASHLVVHGAERFGLAQLHQLRGRIGRAGQKAWTVLLADPDRSEEATRRLRVLTETRDGLEVARADLEHRGMGDPGGRRQAGGSPFRRGDPWYDRAIMKAARQEASERLCATDGLTTPDAILMRRRLKRDYGEQGRYVGVS